MWIKFLGWPNPAFHICWISYMHSFFPNKTESITKSNGLFCRPATKTRRRRGMRIELPSSFRNLIGIVISSSILKSVLFLFLNTLCFLLAVPFIGTRLGCENACGGAYQAVCDSERKKRFRRVPGQVMIGPCRGQCYQNAFCAQPCCAARPGSRSCWRGGPPGPCPGRSLRSGAVCTASARKSVRCFFCLIEWQTAIAPTFYQVIEDPE